MRIAVNPTTRKCMMRMDGTPLRVVLTVIMDQMDDDTGSPSSYLLTKEEAGQLTLDLYAALMQIDEWDAQEPPEYQITEADMSHGETPPNPFEDDLTMEVQP